MYNAHLYSPYEIIKFAVGEVRRKLEPQTSGASSLHPHYAGLCYEATQLFIENIQKSCEKKGLSFKFKSIHGEQRHTPKIPSNQWTAQHQWCWVEISGRRYYVDCTCEQFKHMYPDIPDYYISVKKPKWFIDDRSNIAFNGVTKWINLKIVLKRRVEILDFGPMEVHDGIIEFIQYEIWGRISDGIRKVLRRDKNGK